MKILILIVGMILMTPPAFNGVSKGNKKSCHVAHQDIPTQEIDAEQIILEVSGENTHHFLLSACSIPH